ncbi:MAG: endo-1,4-beta-xylanase [bacterium]|nr:endo-1,4-beta-xylanase [bacterium]
MPQTLTRRSLLTGIGAGVAAGLCPRVSISPAAARMKSLASVAEKAGILFGASVSKEVFENPLYGDLYRSHAKILTTDVALKFDYIRWKEGEWDFSEADKLLDFARQNSQQLRGHTLVWNENAPQWLKRRPSREITLIFEEHIDKVAGRYAGKLHSWDVVNEPFWPGHGKKHGYRTGPWFEAMGPSYVKQAFIRTSQVDPDTRLVLNEAHCERNDRVGKNIRKGLLRLVDELLDAGIALDAIGLQGHLQPTKAYSDKVFTDFLWKLHERGLNIYISEFDIDDSSYPKSLRSRDQLVAKRTHQFLSSVLKVPSVKALICWQLSDRYSWYRQMALEDNPHTKRLPRPLPFDDKLRPKPAYTAMIRALKERRV